MKRFFSICLLVFFAFPFYADDFQLESFRHAGHLRDMNPEAMFTPARRQLAQEDDLLTRLLDRYVEIPNAFERAFHLV